MQKVKIKSITVLPTKESVYNMEVEEHHNFAVNGGVIVHNCDSIRYLLADRPPRADVPLVNNDDDDEDDDRDTRTSYFD